MSKILSTKEFSNISKANRKNGVKWFEDSRKDRDYLLNDIDASCRNKTKIIVSIKKTFDESFYEKCFDQGQRSFRLDCSQMNQREYSGHVRNINDTFSKREEVATILFDLKGPMPFINQIGSNEDCLNLKKGQKLRICYDYRTKTHEQGTLYLDKKIVNGVNIGDTLLINFSNVKLKVVGFEKIGDSKEKNCPFKNVAYSNSSPFLLTPPQSVNKTSVKKEDRNKEYETYFDEIDEEDSKLHNFDDEELLIDATNFDNYFEEKLKNKQQKMTQVYNNFIKRYTNAHTNANVVTNNENKIFNDLDRLSAISGVNCSMISEIEPCASLWRKEKLRKGSSLSTGGGKGNNRILCEVVEEGQITKNRTIGILRKDILKECDIPYISAKDIIDLNKAYSLGIATISVFANSAENIEEIKDILDEEARHKIKFFARIETQTAIMNFDSILAKSDGIVIHHGLISSVLPLEELSLVEVYMIEKCKLQNKPIIIQNFPFKFNNLTKPLLSKISVLDFSAKEGIDSVIIEEETQSQICFFETIKACRDILPQIEAYEDNKLKYEEMSKFFSLNLKKKISFSDSIFDCVARLSYEIKPELIILFTDELGMIKSLTNYRPYCLIVYPCDNERSLKYARVMRGVIPILQKEFYSNASPSETENVINSLVRKLEDKQIIRKTINTIIIVNAFSNTNYKYRNSFSVFYPDKLERGM